MPGQSSSPPYGQVPGRGPVRRPSGPAPRYSADPDGAAGIRVKRPRDGLGRPGSAVTGRRPGYRGRAAAGRSGLRGPAARGCRREGSLSGRVVHARVGGVGTAGPARRRPDRRRPGARAGRQPSSAGRARALPAPGRRGAAGPGRCPARGRPRAARWARCPATARPTPRRATAWRRSASARTVAGLPAQRRPAAVDRRPGRIPGRVGHRLGARLAGRGHRRRVRPRRHRQRQPGRGRAVRGDRRSASGPTRPPPTAAPCQASTARTVIVGTSCRHQLRQRTGKVVWRRPHRRGRAGLAGRRR